MIKKLKSFLFEQEETANNRGSRRDGNDRQRRNENEEENNNKFGYIMVAVFVPITLLIFWIGNKENAEISLNDRTLCPTEERHISGKTYILMDLSEPLSKNQKTELKNLIKVASENLKRHERLSISRMEPDSNNPRVPLVDLCNSVDLDGIENAVGRSINASEHCPAIIKKTFQFHRRYGPETQERIRKICKNQDDLNKIIERAIETVPQINVEQPYSYIIGGIEDIMIDAGGEPRGVPTRLVVFSDMLQNAAWFSQYGNHEEWTINNLMRRRENTDKMGAAPEHTFSKVLLCYQPNKHIGNNVKRLKKHKKMWEEYFEYFVERTENFKPIDFGGCTEATESLMIEN